MKERKSEWKSLTEENVASLEPREDKYDVWDAGKRYVPGFCVRVEPSGRKTFYFRYSLQQGLFWYRIGPVAMGAAEARIEARKLTGDVARGINPHKERMAKRSGLTFEQLQKRYVEEKAKKNNKSWERSDYLIRSFFLPKFGKLSAAGITRPDIRQWFKSMASETTANQVKAAVSAVFKFGIEEEVIKINPCSGVEDNKTDARERILSKSEMPRFWKACDKIHPVKAAALRTIMLLGSRPGEVSWMRREHIKDDGFWEMPGEPQRDDQGKLKWPGTKNKRTHRVWLAPEVRELIAELIDGDAGFVFTNAMGNAIGDLDVAMREISKAENFDPAVTPHDLRRTSASTVTERGHGGEAMDRLLNHYRKSVRAAYDRAWYDRLNRPIWEDVAAAIMTMVRGDNVVAISRAGVQPR
jgi:integrase